MQLLLQLLEELWATLELWMVFLADLTVTTTVYLVAAFRNVHLSCLCDKYHTGGKF